MNKLSIYIKGEELKKYNGLLDIDEIDFEKEGIKEDATLKVINAVFSNGYQVDIKVCSGQTNCYVDAILFDDKGNELVVAEPSFELEGEYSFEVNGETYCVSVSSEDVEQELIYTCDFCNTEIGWESSHSSKGNIWECEECGKMTCTSCIEQHGGTTSETADKILCGNCQTKKQ